MTSIKYGAIVTELKGKSGGHVFQAGRANPIIRTKNGKKVKPQSYRADADFMAFINKIPNLITLISQAWNKLSDANRESWQSLLGIYQFKDKFGDTYNGTAYQIFTSMNMNAKLIDQDLILAAPAYTPLTQADFVPAPYSLDGTWDIDQTIDITDGNICICSCTKPTYESKPVSSLSFFKVKVQVLGAAHSFSLKDKYAALLGYTPPLGSFFYLKIKQYQPAYPQALYEQVYKIEVVA